MSYGANDPNGLPLGLPSILSLGLPPLVNPYPALNLDFINNQTLDSRVTFSRGSQATLFDSTGTLKYAKHNLLLQSQTFQTTWATSTASVSADAGTAPDGTVTADKVIPDNAATGRVQQTFATTTGVTYTFSCFVKAAEFGWVALGMAAPGAYFNLSGAGAVGTTPAGYTASITSVGSGWYRCVVTLTESGGASRTWRINPASADNTLAVGDGTSGILVWGAQLNIANMEGGVTSSLSTYYPTTTAAYYAPRFDYNPSTLQPRGLLIEEQRTNSLLQSQDFTTTWNNSNTTDAADTTTAPDGLTTADTITETTATGLHNVNQSFTPTSGLAYAFSVFVKKGNGASARDFVQLGFPNAQFGSNSYANFDIVNGTVTLTGAGVSSASIVSVGNGWFRCIITDTATGSLATVAIVSLITSGTGANQESYTGTTDANIFLWGAQLEVGAFPTSYIPTTTTALTRNADVATMTGTNFSSWYNASQGTILANTTVLAVAPSTALQGVFAINDGTADNRMVVYKRANADVSTRFDVTAATINSCFLNAGTFTTTNRIAAAYATDNFAAVLNGGSPATDTGGAVPTVTQINIGSYVGATSFLNGHIQRLAYYPTRLPNTTLQALTA